MADYMQHGGQMTTHRDRQMYGTTYSGLHQQQSQSYQMVKAATAITAGGSLLILSALTLSGTVIALTVATPLLVIFSPVLVPAAITVVMLITGFLASGGFGVAAVSVMAWLYRYMTGRHPVGADSLEQARMKLAGKAREAREKGEHYVQQATGGTHQTS